MVSAQLVPIGKEVKVLEGDPVDLTAVMEPQNFSYLVNANDALISPKLQVMEDLASQELSANRDKESQQGATVLLVMTTRETKTME